MELQPSRPMPAAQPATAARGMHQAAEDLEATFIAEMLKPMGAAAPREEFGGGAGEDQFSSFLVEQEARAMARHGGIGLGEAIYRSLAARTGVEP